MEDFERIGRQARPGVELGTSHQSVLSADSLSHMWGPN